MMSPVIRVSDETYRRIQGWAVPLEDTVDSVLNRVLDAAEKNSAPASSPLGTSVQQLVRGSSEAAREAGPMTPESTFYALILSTLHQMGGSGEKAEVTRRIGQLLKDQLTPLDWEAVATGEARWENKVAWARNRMCELGYMRRGGQRGIWELTDDGAAMAEDRDWPATWQTPNIAP